MAGAGLTAQKTSGTDWSSANQACLAAALEVVAGRLARADVEDRVRRRDRLRAQLDSPFCAGRHRRGLRVVRLRAGEPRAVRRRGAGLGDRPGLRGGARRPRAALCDVRPRSRRPSRPALVRALPGSTAAAVEPGQRHPSGGTDHQPAAHRRASAARPRRHAYLDPRVGGPRPAGTRSSTCRYPRGCGARRSVWWHCGPRPRPPARPARRAGHACTGPATATCAQSSRPPRRLSAAGGPAVRPRRVGHGRRARATGAAVRAGDRTRGLVLGVRRRTTPSRTPAGPPWSSAAACTRRSRCSATSRTATTSGPTGRGPASPSVELSGAWRRAIGPVRPVDAGWPDRLAGQFHLGITDVAAVLDDVAPGGAEAPRGTRLWAACRGRARPRARRPRRSGSRRGPTGRTSCSRRPAALLREIDRPRPAPVTVFDDWGFARRTQPRPRHRARCSPGRAAPARRWPPRCSPATCELDLYRIDLSQVVSKYIGETEKNLRRVFDAAEAGGAVLLFDEADALFGKRSEVKDSHDRYANIEVSYLLAADGGLPRAGRSSPRTCKDALDTAFLRRLRFVVQFPFPDADSAPRSGGGSSRPRRPPRASTWRRWPGCRRLRRHHPQHRAGRRVPRRRRRRARCAWRTCCAAARTEYAKLGSP